MNHFYFALMISILISSRDHMYTVKVILEWFALAYLTTITLSKAVRDCARWSRIAVFQRRHIERLVVVFFAWFSFLGSVFGHYAKRLLDSSDLFFDKVYPFLGSLILSLDTHDLPEEHIILFLLRPYLNLKGLVVIEQGWLEVVKLIWALCDHRVC